MSSRKKIDPTDYENRSFADEFSEAIANKTLIKAVPGKNIIEVAREHHFAKNKSETVSVKLPNSLIAVIKRQAKSVSVPWTSYIKEVLEVGVGRAATESTEYQAKAMLAE